jgi:hypothetical protein
MLCHYGALKPEYKEEVEPIIQTTFANAPSTHENFLNE